MLSDFDTSYESMKNADIVYRERAWSQTDPMMDILIDQSNPFAERSAKRSLVNGSSSSQTKPCWCHSMPYTGGPGDARAAAEVSRLEELVRSLSASLNEARDALSRVRGSASVAPAPQYFPRAGAFQAHSVKSTYTQS